MQWKEHFICSRSTFLLIELQVGYQGNIFRILIGMSFYKTELICHFNMCVKLHIVEFLSQDRSKLFSLRLLQYFV